MIYVYQELVIELYFLSQKIERGSRLSFDLHGRSVSIPLPKFPKSEKEKSYNWSELVKLICL